MTTVEVISAGDCFVVRTTRDDAVADMHFTLEKFALLYAQGQRVHFQVLEEMERLSKSYLAEAGS